MTKATQRRYAALDGLRGIAALMVFAIHVWIYQLPNTVELRRDSWEKTLLFEGRVAFVMFFVLSGYLLYRAFARAALGSSAPVAVGSYLVRRAARIMPAYYLALAGTLVLLAAAGDVPGRRLVDAGELPALLPVRAELLARHAAEAECRHVDADGRGRLLPAAAADRAGRAAAAAAARGRQALLLGALAVAGLAWNYVDYLAGWGPVASHSAIVVPALLRLRDAGRAAGRGDAARRRGRRSGAARAAAWSPARRRCWSLTAAGTRPATTTSLAMEVFADSAPRSPSRL